MVSPRPLILVVALLVGAAGTGAGQVSELASSPMPGDRADEISASTTMLPCIPVAAYWSGPPPSPGMPPGPELAVVSIKVRPKDARVYLDDRFVGRARYLDGKPGYLYLEPGAYRLELRLDGHQTLVMGVEASSACRYDLKHRLQKSGAKASDAPESMYGKGKPFNRVFGPVAKNEPEQVTRKSGGPDPSLRADLDASPGAGTSTKKTPGASLQLRVSPDTASVSIDGVFVATGRELALMERPLATTAGSHEVFVRAPGHVAASKSVVLEPGEVLVLEFTLSKEATD